MYWVTLSNSVFKLWNIKEKKLKDFTCSPGEGIDVFSSTQDSYIMLEETMTFLLSLFED